MDKIKNLARFTLSNFGPLIAFYLANHFLGLKAALAATLLWTAGEITLSRFRKRPITVFFKFSATVTIVFGAVDLYLAKAVFFKYEAALTSTLTGCYFAGTLLARGDRKPLIQQFAEAQGRLKKEVTPDAAYFFKFLTSVWCAYFFVKAAFYVWVAQAYSLEEGLAIRSVAGNASMYGLLALSIFGGRPIMRILGHLRLLPSTYSPRSRSK